MSEKVVPIKRYRSMLESVRVGLGIYQSQQKVVCELLHTAASDIDNPDAWKRLTDAVQSDWPEQLDAEQYRRLANVLIRAASEFASSSWHLGGAECQFPINFALMIREDRESLEYELASVGLRIIEDPSVIPDWARK